MQKFLTLLDPHQTGTGISAVGNQQDRAGLEFPRLVDSSNLYYWQLGDPIASEGTRYLLALAVTFSRFDLCFADIVNEALTRLNVDQKRVDVFAITDAPSWEALSDYYSGTQIPFLGWDTHPIVGIWKDGIFQITLIGANGVNYVLRDLNVATTAEEIAKSL